MYSRMQNSNPYGVMYVLCLTVGVKLEQWLRWLTLKTPTVLNSHDRATHNYYSCFFPQKRKPKT